MYTSPLWEGPIQCATEINPCSIMEHIWPRSDIRPRDLKENEPCFSFPSLTPLEMVFWFSEHITLFAKTSLSPHHLKKFRTLQHRYKHCSRAVALDATLFKFPCSYCPIEVQCRGSSNYILGHLQYDYEHYDQQSCKWFLSLRIMYSTSMNGENGRTKYMD